MKPKSTIALISRYAALFLLLCVCNAAAGKDPLITVDMKPFNPKALPGPHPSTRRRVCLNGMWDFFPILEAEPRHGPVLEALPPLPKPGEWKRFQVPATWKQVSGVWSAYYYDMPKEWCKAHRAWYRREFKVPRAMRGKRVKLQFNGVLVYAEMFVNNKSVGKHYCGVTPFTIDITDAVRFGQANSLRVYVVNQNIHFIKKPKSRYNFSVRAPLYYSYSQNSAGIWGDVFLLGEPETTVSDAFVMTSVRKQTITAQVSLQNSGATSVRAGVTPVVKDLDGKVVKRFAPRTVAVKPGKEAVLKFQSKWLNPRLWSPEDPHLYRLHTQVMVNGALKDEHFQRFGFREFWIEGRNFLLNGRRVSLFGDWIGARACTSPTWQRPEFLRLFFKTFKEANYLGTRLQAAGIPPCALDICDEIGFPVIATGISDSARFFDPAYADEATRHAQKDARDWVRRNRNHPSILIWSTENEDDPAGSGEKVLERYREIDRAVINMDPTRPFVHDGNRHCGGDLKGWAPIKNYHYTGGAISLERQIHQFDQWSRDGKKPRIEGEISNYALEFSHFSHFFRHMGDRVFGELDTRYREADRVVRLQGGGWRAAGLSGMMLFGNQNAIMNAPLNAWLLQRGHNFRPGRIAKLKWDDLTTPGLKPRYLARSNLAFFNPWVKAAPTVIKTPLFESIRNVYNPALVTLARATEHTYWSGEKARKQVYVVNESPQALRSAALRWHLEDAQGKPLARGSVTCAFKQGERRAVEVALQLPQCDTRTETRFRAELVSAEGKTLSADEMDLAVYPRPERLRLTNAPLALYDRAGRTEIILRREKVAYKKTGARDLASLPPDAFLVIGCGAADQQLIASESVLTAFVARGGRVLVMAQPMAKPCSRSVAFVRAPNHPVFKGLPAERLMFWRAKTQEIASAALRANLSLRQIVLADVLAASRPIYSGYAPVLLESAGLKGKAVLCNLNLTDACEQGDPEAIILFRNLLQYTAAPKKTKRAGALYTGGEPARKFFGATPRVAKDKWVGTADDPALLIIGEGAKPAALQARKQELAAFVKQGGTVLFAGTPTPGPIAWTPIPITARRLPQTDEQGAYHLWKRSDSRLLDGLGDLFILNSPRAKNYYVGDAISGLTHGFARPRAPWITGYEIAARKTCSYKGLRRRPHYESNGDAALVILPYGKGAYILSALPARKTEIATRLYGALLANHNAPAPRTQPFLAFAGLKANQSLTPATARDWRSFTPVDLVPYANRDFMDTETGDKQGGWDDSGDNDMRNLPTGDFMMGVVPFHIIDLDKDDPNGDRGIKLGHPIHSCIVLQNRARSYFPAQVKGIRVGRKARKIHFLHTSTYSGAAAQKERVARYVIHYQDGTAHTVEVRNGIEVADWWLATKAPPKNAFVAWTGGNARTAGIGLYRLTVYNPRKDKVITAIDFISDRKAIPILVAITLQR